MIEKLTFLGRVFLLLALIAGCSASSSKYEDETALRSKLQLVSSSNVQSVVVKKMNCYTSTFAPVSPENFESRNTLSVELITDSLKISDVLLSLNELFQEAKISDKQEIDCRLLLELNYFDHTEQYYFGFPGGMMFHNDIYYQCSVRDVKSEPCLVYSGIEDVVE